MRIRAVVIVVTLSLLAPSGSTSLAVAVTPIESEAAQSDIDSLLAPIALYPDALLSQILICSMDPEGVRRFDVWLSGQTAKGSALQDAAVLANFEASFVALAVFPQVVKAMATNLERTKLVGEVFAADRNAVFASIQKLRAQAQKVGTLKTTPQQQVETQTTSSGQQVIVIEPTNPEVVYVPQYNPTVVYTQPPTQTVVVQSGSSADAVAAGMIGFTAGIVIGAASNPYYYGPYGWHGGGYMYNDAWDDYWDHREDAREDWQDHREDLNEQRGERREDLSEQRGDRAQSGQQQRTQRQDTRQQNRSTSGTQQQRGTGTQATTQQQSATPRSSGNYDARGKTPGTTTQRAAPERSGTKSDAFSGYSSGGSQRAASSRGQASRGSRGGGGGRRR